MARCNVCFRHCDIADGETGFCGARTAKDGKVICANYGKVTSLALDPIEKKPLKRFCPGSLILSVGSYGCNLRCPFCQNCEISWSDEAMRFSETADRITPEQLADTAEYYKNAGNVGVAYTYNEPLIGYEFVRDAAKLVHERGMKNVLVTNGTASTEVLDEIAPYIDAMNIDLKGFTDDYYSRVLGGSRSMVMDFIERSAGTCHIELTTLVVPGENDSEDEMAALSEWVAGLPGGPKIPLHITRFFPRFHMTDREPTDIAVMRRLAGIAGRKLEYVYLGNV